jgi:CPA2 family monovalent cation:H+ antiporter-2/glutathione-regulated potassium-efflux system protein KefB
VSLIDRDVEMIEAAGSFGAKVYYGDGTRIDLLRQAGAHDAQLLLFCIDGDVLDADILTAVHNAFPEAAIFARAYDRRSLIKMHGAPLAGTVREVLESAVCMARLAMQEIGVDEGEIDETEQLYRDRDRERLDAQAESGDIRAGREKIITKGLVIGSGDCG